MLHITSTLFRSAQAVLIKWRNIDRSKRRDPDDVQFSTVTANLTGNVTGQTSDISNHSTTNLQDEQLIFYMNPF